MDLPTKDGKPLLENRGTSRRGFLAGAVVFAGWLVWWFGRGWSSNEPDAAPRRAQAALLLHVVYHRAIDHRRFRFTRTALLVFDHAGEQVQHLMDRDAMHYRSVGDERERAA